VDPAEEIVSLWLQNQGFFIMSDVKVGHRGKEIDFLAIHPSSNRKVHIEVHASVFPLGPLRPWGPVKYGKLPVAERVKHYYNDKFVGITQEGTGELRNQCIQEAATGKLLNKTYERWLVLGRLHPKDSEEQIKHEFQKHGVTVYFLKEILRNINFLGAARDSIGRFIQLMASQLDDETRKCLLERRKTANTKTRSKKQIKKESNHLVRNHVFLPND
jgi:hypothetical protein